MGYLTNFIVYTLAMVGVMVLALWVFKNSTCGTGSKGGSKYLKVIDTMSIGPRKTLYIVSAGEEKFLIAGDVDKTSLISKLESRPETARMTFKETMEKADYMDRTGIGIRSTQNSPYTSVMKNLAEKMKEGTFHE